MSEFNKDDYLNDLPDAADAGDGAAAGAAGRNGGPSASADASAQGDNNAADAAGQGDTKAAGGPSASAQGDSGNAGAQGGGPSASGGVSAQDDKSAASANGEADTDKDGGLTPLGQAKKEAADYLEALQRERAEFINFRNRAAKEQERFRQHGIIDVLTALLPVLDDLDRIREHGQMDEAFQAVATKIDKAFEKFGVEKFGEKGEEFDPTKHEAILHKPDGTAEKDTVDVVVEAGYRIGDRVIRAARVVVASPQA